MDANTHSRVVGSDSGDALAITIIGSTAGTDLGNTGMVVRPHQAQAMQNVVPVAQKLQACMSQLLPKLLQGEARNYMENMLLEVTELKDANAEMIKILSSGCQEFCSLKTAFDMIARKVEFAVQENVPVEDLEFEFERMREILDALIVKAKDVKDFKEAQDKKPKVTAKFQAAMMDKVSQDDSAKVNHELNEIKQKKKEIQAEREKMTARISQARQDLHSGQARVAHATQISVHRGKEITALDGQLLQRKKEYEECQAKVDEKKAECGRVRERHSKMTTGVLSNFTKKQGEIMERAEAEKSVLDQNRRKLEGELLPQELAALGKTYEGNHFVLCCDQSGSMSGAKWGELLSSVEAMEQPSGNHSFSLILFNDNRQCLAWDQPMSNFRKYVADLKTKSACGGTSFSAAWQEIQLVVKGSDQSRKHVVLFMTDGRTSDADIAAAANLASLTYQESSGRMSAFIVPYDIGSGDNMMPIVKAGNGGKEFLSPTDNPSLQIPFLNKAILGELQSVFSKIKVVAENDLQAIKEKIRSYHERTSADISKSQEDGLAKLKSNTDKRISSINHQRDQELTNLTAEIGPLETELSKKRERLSQVELLMQKKRDEEDGSLGQIQAEFQSTDESANRVILEATKERDALDAQDAVLEAREKEVWSKQPKVEGWFENEDSQNFVSVVLASFCDLQRSQDMVQHFSAEMFEQAFSWIRKIYDELRKPTARDLPRADQFKLLIKYYMDVVKSVNDKPIQGTAISMNEDARLIFTDMCRRSGRKFSEEQIDESLDTILTVEPAPQNLIFIGTDPKDSKREHDSWMKQLQGKVNNQASMSAGRDDLRKKQDAVAKKGG